MGRKIIVIAGGGTGGHIYPGIAIARSLIKKNPELEIHFVGTPLGLENQIVPREGFKLHLIKVGKLNESAGLASKLKTLIQIPKALFDSMCLLSELKPVYVLGVGGYASGPFVLVATILGFRSAIWEPNAHPGMTNRWLSRFVRKSFVVFKEAAQLLRSREVIPMGLPVRELIEKIGSQVPQRRPNFRILVFGGSQGARGINEVVSELFAAKKESLAGVQLVHQTGRNDFAQVKGKYVGLGDQVQCLEFLHDMEKRYEWADLVICRAGASTVAEIAACAKPAIFIPLPTAADNHQQKNAESLVRQQASVMILQKDLTPDVLEKHILELQNNSELRQKMSENLKKFYKPQAAEALSQAIIDGAEL